MDSIAAQGVFLKVLLRVSLAPRSALHAAHPQIKWTATHAD
jgi:hypothetical protein